MPFDNSNNNSGVTGAVTGVTGTVCLTQYHCALLKPAIDSIPLSLAQLLAAFLRL